MQELNISINSNNIEEKNYVDYAETNRVILLLFCGYIVIWYLQIGARIPILASIRFEYIYAVLLSVIALFSLGKNYFNCPLIFYGFLYYMILIIQIPISYDFETSWNVFIERVLKFTFMAAFIVCFVKSPRDMRYFAAAFILACLKMGQEGFWGKITGSMMWENQGVMRLHGTTGLYEHPNSFAGMALGTLPFVYYLWAGSNRIIKAVFLIQIAFALNIIIFSGSRTGYVGFFILIFLFFIESKSKRTFLLYGATIFLISYLIIPQDYVKRAETIYTLEEEQGRSSETRIEILKDAWEIFSTHPLGIGVAAFPAIRRDILGRYQDTHNLYLEVATNLGIQGVLIFFLFVYKMLLLLNNLGRDVSAQVRSLKENALVKGLLDNKESEIRKHLDDLTLLHSMCRAVFSFIILRLGVGLFGSDLYEIYWWFAAGLTVAIFNINIIAREKTEGLINKHSPANTQIKTI